MLVADIDGARAERVAGEIGGAARAATADVAKGADFQRMVARPRGLRPPRHRGQQRRHHAPNQPLLEVDEATYDRVYAVNVKSIYWSAQHAVPVFRRQGGGCFVNIASTRRAAPRPGLTWYNGSKGAVIMISKSMAVELAPDRSGSTPSAR